MRLGNTRFILAQAEYHSFSISDLAAGRSALFVAAMVVTNMKQPNKLKEYYEKLLAKGKAKMVALDHKIVEHRLLDSQK